MQPPRIPCHRLTRDVHGIALPLALFALVVVNGLVAAALWLAMIESRASRSVQALAEALGQAELAAANALIAPLAGRVEIGSEMVDTVLTPAGLILSTAGRRRLNDRLFLVTGTGTSGDGAALQRVSILARLEERPIAAAGPLSSALPLQIGPQVRLEREPANVDGICAGDESEIVGIPAMADTMAQSVESLSEWMDWATRVVPPGVYAGIGPTSANDLCQVEDLENWGDPGIGMPPCFGYLPVVHVPGDLVLLGGEGQGVLLVEGDLTVGGGSYFRGLVLVGGSLHMRGPGTRIVGSVQVMGSHSGSVQLADGVLIRFSECVMDRISGIAARLRPIDRRAWMNTF